MKGKIYRIICNKTGEQYIGSTTRSLEDRLSKHKSPTNTCTSKQIIERGDFEMQLIEEVEVNDRTHLHQIEAEHIKNNKCINKVMPYRTPEEKKQMKREYQRSEKFKIYSKNYYQNYNAKFTIINLCPCGGKWKFPCSYKKHLKTKKHNKWAESQPTEEETVDESQDDPDFIESTSE